MADEWQPCSVRSPRPSLKDGRSRMSNPSCWPSLAELLHNLKLLEVLSAAEEHVDIHGEAALHSGERR